MNTPLNTSSPVCEKSTKIERVTCSRCGGTGRMPFAVYGGICFKCGGKGTLLTKRGRMAEECLRLLRSKPASTLKVGDVIQVQHWFPSAIVYTFDKIVTLEPRTEANASSWSINPDGSKHIQPGLKLVTENAKYGSMSSIEAPDKMIRVAQTAEQKAATLQQALEYQDTLTKSGTVRKTKAAHV